MEAKEYKGQWWIPARQDKKVAGILYYKPSEEFRLELIGSFETQNDDSIAAIFSAKEEDVIHGQASDGTKISLFNSHYCHISHIGKADFSLVVYKAKEIAIGIHLNSPDDKRCFKASVRIPELSYWLYPAALQQVIFNDSDDALGIHISMIAQKEEYREVAKTEVKKGIKICLCRNASFQGGDQSFKPIFEQFTSLQIESSSEISMLDLYTLAVRFEHFMSLATLREVGFTDLYVYSKEYYFTVGKMVHYNPVSIDTTYHQHPCEKEIKDYNFLFDYKKVVDVYPKIIKKWFANDWKFDAIRGHFLESIDYHGFFSYVNFLVVIQAVEGYGNRYLKKNIEAYRKSLPANTKTRRLHNILTTIIRLYADVRSVNPSIDVDAIVETRNYHSHLLAQRGKNCADGLELYRLTDELRKVLICCILSYLGFSNQQIDQLTSATNNNLFRN